jgi:signal transduction histidine kinase
VGQHYGVCGLTGGLGLLTLAHVGSAAALLGATSCVGAPPVPTANPDGGLAHDVNHLVGLIADYADQVHERVLQCEPKGCWSDDVTEQVVHDSASLVACTERVGLLTGRLLQPGRDDSRPEPVDVNRLVRDLEPLLGPESPGRVRLDHHLEPGLWPVVADRIGLEQVLMNLCGNAREAMGDRGRLSIATENVLVDADSVVAGRGFGPGLAPGPYVCLTVTDNGPGMTADIVARVAERGFSTKGPGRNRGLGLTTVVGVLSRMGGDLQLCSAPGRGTVARVYVPAERQAAVSAGAPAGAGTGAGADADGG